MFRFITRCFSTSEKNRFSWPQISKEKNVRTSLFPSMRLPSYSIPKHIKERPKKTYDFETALKAMRDYNWDESHMADGIRETGRLNPGALAAIGTGALVGVVSIIKRRRKRMIIHENKKSASKKKGIEKND